MTAAAPVVASCLRYLARARNAIVPGPADSSVATCETRTDPSPSTTAPTSCASSERDGDTGGLRWEATAAGAPGPVGRLESLLVGERLDHLLGDVDFLAGKDDRILQYQVELLGFRDLLDDLVRAILD